MGTIPIHLYPSTLLRINIYSLTGLLLWSSTIWKLKNVIDNLISKIFFSLNLLDIQKENHLYENLMQTLENMLGPLFPSLCMYLYLIFWLAPKHIWEPIRSLDQWTPYYKSNRAKHYTNSQYKLIMRKIMYKPLCHHINKWIHPLKYNKIINLQLKAIQQ